MSDFLRCMSKPHVYYTSPKTEPDILFFNKIYKYHFSDKTVFLKNIVNIAENGFHLPSDGSFWNTQIGRYLHMRFSQLFMHDEDGAVGRINRVEILVNTTVQFISFDFIRIVGTVISCGWYGKLFDFEIDISAVFFQDIDRIIVRGSVKKRSNRWFVDFTGFGILDQIREGLVKNILRGIGITRYSPKIDEEFPWTCFVNCGELFSGSIL